MLERIWRKRNSLALLVGMQIDTTTMENSMEIPLKTRNRTTIWPSNPTTGHIPWENHNCKRFLYPSVAALFTIPRTGRHLDVHWQMNGYRNCGEIENINHSVMSDSLRTNGACQARLSMELSRQEYWGGLPFPSPGDLPQNYSTYMQWNITQL